MKKIIGLSLACLLGGCVNQPPCTQDCRPEPFHTMKELPLLDRAPLPWVHVLPSARSVALKDVDFYFMSQHIRQHMFLNLSKFRDVNLVLVDYTILAPVEPNETFMKHPYGGQIYCKKYISKPRRYFLSLSFYQQGHRPPEPAFFVGTSVVNVEKGPPLETFRFMIHEIVADHVRLPQSKIDIVLDGSF